MFSCVTHSVFYVRYIQLKSLTVLFLSLFPPPPPSLPGWIDIFKGDRMQLSPPPSVHLICALIRPSVSSLGLYLSCAIDLLIWAGVGGESHVSLSLSGSQWRDGRRAEVLSLNAVSIFCPKKDYCPTLGVHKMTSPPQWRGTGELGVCFPLMREPAYI